MPSADDEISNEVTLREDMRRVLHDAITDLADFAAGDQEEIRRVLARLIAAEKNLCDNPENCKKCGARCAPEQSCQSRPGTGTDQRPDSAFRSPYLCRPVRSVTEVVLERLHKGERANPPAAPGPRDAASSSALF